MRQTLDKCKSKNWASVVIGACLSTPGLTGFEYPATKNTI